MPTIHTLKCHAQYFDAVVTGDKCFDVRLDDRHFELGDQLRLVRTDETGKILLPSREIVKHVHFMLEGGQFGIEPGYVVLGFSRGYSLDDFDDDAIEAEFEKRFGIPDQPLERIHGLLAEGAITEAMDEMSRAFDLPDPAHARRVASRIAAGRQGELHV